MLKDKMMKNKANQNFIRIAAVAIALMLIAVLFSSAMSAYKKRWTAIEISQTVAIGALPRKKEYDPALIETFKKVCENFDQSKQEIMFSGTVSVWNKADTLSAGPKALSYYYRKKGEDFYYRLGNTETINTGGLCVYLDKDQKTVMLSAGRKEPIMDLNKVCDNMLTENYELKSTLEGEEQTLTFLNEYHISCKQYTLSFNSGSLMPTRLFIRLSDPYETLNKSKEQWIDMRFDTKEKNNAPLPTVQKIVEKKGNEYVLCKAYADYKLIM